MTQWYVYLIQSKRDGSIYTGITTDPIRRLDQHNQGSGAKRTRGRGPWVILCTQMYPNRSTALREEARIKKLSRTEKELYIAHYGETAILRLP